MASRSPLGYAFDGFELDLVRGRLTREGDPIALDARPSALLAYLIRCRDRVVPRDEILREVWGGVAVSDAAFASALRDLRRALGDSGGSQRLVRTIRGEGLRFVAEARALRPPPPAYPVDASTGLVGRERVLGALQEALSSADAGRGRVVLLLGEAGIGKTRIGEEFASLARERGARAFEAGCPEGTDAGPYWPWRVLLRAAEREAGVLSRLTDDEAELLAGAIPEARRDAAGGRAIEVNPGAARFRLLDHLTGLLVELAAEQSLVLFVDDLHRADLASLQVFERLAERASEARLVLLGSYRDTGVKATSALATALGRVARHGYATTEALPPLEPGEVTDFVARATGSEPESAEVALLYERSGGNPLLLEELVALRVASPDTAGSALPSGSHGAVAAHLACLSPDCRELLRVASVFGRRFSLTPLARAADLPLDRCAVLAEEGLAARILNRDEAGDACRFAHALIAETLYEGLPADERIALHGRVGRALESAVGSESDRAAELAHHFSEAAPAGFAKEALRHCRRAGELASRGLAYEEAVRHYRRALSLLSEASAGDDERLAVLLELGDALARSGEAEPARSSFREACDLARRNSHWEAFARAALGFALGEEGGAPVPERVATLREALEHVADASPLRARLLGRLGYALWFGEPRERARSLMHEAIARARDCGDVETLYYVLSRAHWVLVGPGRLEERRAISSDLVRLADEIRDPVLVASTRVASVWDALAAGDPVASERQLAQLEREALELRAPIVEWWAGVLRAARCFLRGRLDEAETLSTAALEIGRSAGGSWHEATHQILIEKIRRYQGRMREMEPALRQLARGFPEQRTFGLALLYCEVLGGEPEGARVELRRQIDSEFVELRDDVNWYNLAHFLVWICEALEAREEAGALYDLLLPVAGECIVAAPGWLYLGAVDRWLGVLASLRAEWDLAEDHFVRGLERDRRMGAVLCRAEGLVQYGRMLGARGDADAARGALLEGQALARSMGLAEIEIRATALLETRR